jgi:hypothetical protein
VLARDQKLDTILRISRLHSYAIPRYQREYRWTATRWTRLYDDIQENDPGYFIGAIIFIKANPEEHGIQQYDVVDGQQRLATISIALAALYRSVRERLYQHESQKTAIRSRSKTLNTQLKQFDSKIIELEGLPRRTAKQEASLATTKLKQITTQTELNKNSTAATAEQRAFEELVAIKQPLEEMLLINDTENRVTDTPRIALSSQKQNNLHYTNILRHSGAYDRDAEATSLPRTLGTSKSTNIGKCFQFFYRTFSSRKDFSSSDLVRFYRKIADLTIVDVKASNTADAYVLFESLNNRGEALTGLDLIKNQTLSRIEEGRKETPPAFSVTLDAATSQWQSFITALPDASDQDKFLRHLYLAFKKKLPAFAVKDSDKVTAKSVVSTIYPTLIKRNAATLLDHFAAHASLYSQLASPEQVTETSIRRGLMNLALISAIPARIPLLYLLATFTDRRELVIAPVVDLLSRFFIRRHLADHPKTRVLEEYFLDLTEKLVDSGPTATPTQIASIVEQHLAESAPPPASLLTALREDIGDNSSFARALLIRTETWSHPPETVPDLWAASGAGLPTYTLEHILPQGELKTGNWWRSHLSPSAPESADGIQADYCQRLGNLTLTSFNQELSNDTFPKKRDYSRNGQPAGYRNGLKINHYVAEQSSWGPSQIDERTDLLIRKLVPTLLFVGEIPPDYSAEPLSEDPHDSDPGSINTVSDATISSAIEIPASDGDDTRI